MNVSRLKLTVDENWVAFFVYRAALERIVKAASMGDLNAKDLGALAQAVLSVIPTEVTVGHSRVPNVPSASRPPIETAEHRKQKSSG